MREGMQLGDHLRSTFSSRLQDWNQHAAALVLPALLMVASCETVSAQTELALSAETSNAAVIRQPELVDIAVDGGQFSQAFRTSRYVSVRDGTKLAMNIYRPAADGRVVEASMPVVFVATPYRARFQGDDGVVNEVALSERLGLRNLIANGYVVAVADIRGKGASYGWRRGFQDRTEALDLRDLIAWLADQPWSTGNIGMTGCSYLGGSTMHAASTAPPALKAVFVGATDMDKFAFVRRGGVTAQFNTRPDEPLSMDMQSLPMDEDVDGAMRDEAVRMHAHNTPMGPLWYGMTHRDSLSAYTGTRFWEEASPYSYMDTLKSADIAYYLWSNWEDEPTEQVILLAKNLNAQLLVGPGSHCVPPPQMDFQGEVVRFFDYHLKGVDNGMAEQARVKYWRDSLSGAGFWVEGDAVPGEGQIMQRMIVGNGSLSEFGDERTDAGTSGTTSLTVNYDISNEAYFAFWPESQSENGAVFTSEPFEKDVVIAGYPVVNLKLKSDQDDPIVFSYLEAVSDAGETSVLSFGRLAGEHRKVSEPPYEAMGLPWHSGRIADALSAPAGEVMDLKFTLLPMVRKVPLGTRLRLVVAGADPRQRNLAVLARDPAPTFTIFHGDGQSWIDLPVCQAGNKACASEAK